MKRVGVATACVAVASGTPSLKSDFTFLTDTEGKSLPIRTLYEDDAPVLTDGCTKLQYTKISFQVEEVQNLPLPANPAQMYVALKWGEDDVKITEYRNTTFVEPNTVSSIQIIESPDRDTSWKKDGWFEFEGKCGEDRVTFEIWEKSTDELVLDYVTRASVSDYYELVGESTSCWYIERDSEAIVDRGGRDPDDNLSSRTVYLKWCVKVVCDEADSCHRPVSTLAWVTILSLFLFPALLCMCCLFCMSTSAGNLYLGCSKCISDAWTMARRGCRRETTRVGDERGSDHRGRGAGRERGRNRGQQEVELGEMGRRDDRPPSPPPRVNYIKSQHTAWTLDRLERSAGTQYEDVTCAICLSLLEKRDEVKKLRCQHLFHADCVDLWGETANTCPLCKMDFCSQEQPAATEGSQASSSTAGQQARGGTSFANRLLGMNLLRRQAAVTRRAGGAEPVPVQDDQERAATVERESEENVEEEEDDDDDEGKADEDVRVDRRRSGGGNRIEYNAIGSAGGAEQGSISPSSSGGGSRGGAISALRPPSASRDDEAASSAPAAADRDAAANPSGADVAATSHQVGGSIEATI